MPPIDDCRADVVIIGSGMGGATTALALARRGIEVLVVERGERLPREPENYRCCRTRSGEQRAGSVVQGS
jgi:2-polyprenyl-6-methoxyphenol hydroxylase-like FAD-dependent oxidoreductase